MRVAIPEQASGLEVHLEVEKPESGKGRVIYVVADGTRVAFRSMSGSGKVVDINKNMPLVREWQADPAGKIREVEDMLREAAKLFMATGEKADALRALKAAGKARRFAEKLEKGEI